jgi:hypothetical protein
LGQSTHHLGESEKLFSPFVLSRIVAFKYKLTTTDLVTPGFSVGRHKRIGRQRIILERSKRDYGSYGENKLVAKVQN